MASTCTIVIPLSDLDLDDGTTVSTVQRTVHNMDINMCPSLQQCDISIEKGGESLPLTATHQNSTVNLQVTDKAWTNWWKGAGTSDTTGSLSTRPDGIGSPTSRSVQSTKNAASSWSRSHSLDGIADPSMVRLARQRQRLSEHMRSLSLERSWGRESGTQDEVIIHGEAPIHDAAKHVIQEVGMYTTRHLPPKQYLTEYSAWPLARTSLCQDQFGAERVSSTIGSDSMYVFCICGFLRPFLKEILMTTRWIIPTAVICVSYL